MSWLVFFCRRLWVWIRFSQTSRKLPSMIRNRRHCGRCSADTHPSSLLRFKSGCFKAGRIPPSRYSLIFNICRVSFPFFLMRKSRESYLSTEKFPHQWCSHFFHKGVVHFLAQSALRGRILYFIRQIIQARQNIRARRHGSSLVPWSSSRAVLLQRPGVIGSRENSSPGSSAWCWESSQGNAAAGISVIAWKTQELLGNKTWERSV